CMQTSPFRSVRPFERDNRASVLRTPNRANCPKLFGVVRVGRQKEERLILLAPLKSQLKKTGRLGSESGRSRSICILGTSCECPTYAGFQTMPQNFMKMLYLDRS